VTNATLPFNRTATSLTLLPDLAGM
jgi:hypothetical protein